MPDDEFLDSSRLTSKFFNRNRDGIYSLKTAEEFEKEQKCQLEPHKQYFSLENLAQLGAYYEKSTFRQRAGNDDLLTLPSFIHFLNGLLCINPGQRWNAAQAMQHPFILNQPFDGSWQADPG